MIAVVVYYMLLCWGGGRLVFAGLVSLTFPDSSPYSSYSSELFVLGGGCVYLCVLYGSQNKQRLFPYTTLTDWFL